MSKDCRQHYEMATGKGVKSDVQGPPTSDVFEGKGGAAGNIYGGDGGQKPADSASPTFTPSANPSHGKW